MISCPYAALMPGSMDSRKWTVNELISSFRCYNCLSDSMNRWAPCVRQAAQINTHPNLCSRPRQIWFLVFLFLKFIKGKSDYDDEDYFFDGPHTIEHHIYNPHANDRRQITDYIPKYLQQSTIIRRGKSTLNFCTSLGKLPLNSQTVTNC